MNSLLAEALLVSVNSPIFIHLSTKILLWSFSMILDSFWSSKTWHGCSLTLELITSKVIGFIRLKNMNRPMSEKTHLRISFAIFLSKNKNWITLRIAVFLFFKQKLSTLIFNSPKRKVSDRMTRHLRNVIYRKAYLKFTYVVLFLFLPSKTLRTKLFIKPTYPTEPVFKQSKSNWNCKTLISYVSLTAM